MTRRRTDAAKEEAKAINAEMAAIAELSLIEASTVVRNARRGLRAAGSEASGKAKAALAELETTIALLERVVAQTRLRLAGGMPEGASRVVSLHDGDARPIRAVALIKRTSQRPSNSRRIHLLMKQVSKDHVPIRVAVDVGYCTC